MIVKISIIIPLYNKENSIKNTIQSVLNQTYQDFEIVIVNDGSTDRSAEKVKEVVDDRVRLINKVNGGVSSARNKGIEEVKYEWIAFLDGDDEWHNKHLELLVLSKKKFPNEFVFTNSYTDNKNKLNGTINDKAYLIVDYFKRALEEKIINSSTCLINKACFAEVGYFNERLRRGEDLEMWYRIARKYNIVANPTKTVLYRLDAENRAMSKVSPYINSFASVINLKGIDSIEEKNYLKSQIKAKYKSCIANREWNNMWECFKQHKFSFL